MRKAITCIENPYLAIKIYHDYLTVGEIGNILIRLQAILRSLADLSRGRREQPRFIIRSIRARRSLEILVLLSILTVTASIPQNLTFYQEVAGQAFKRLKLATLAMAGSKGLKIKLVRGEIDFRLAQELLDELSPIQRKKLADFISALTKPTNRILIRDDELEAVLKWAEPPRLL